MESATLTLTEFLLARIADDESMFEQIAGYYCGEPNALFAWGHEIDLNKSRLLIECQAKRRIVEEHRSDLDTSDPCDAHGPSYETIPCATLLFLALPYAGHPDYLKDWRV